MATAGGELRAGVAALPRRLCRGCPVEEQAQGIGRARGQARQRSRRPALARSPPHGACRNKRARARRPPRRRRRDHRPSGVAPRWGRHRLRSPSARPSGRRRGRSSAGRGALAGGVAPALRGDPALAGHAPDLANPSARGTSADALLDERPVDRPRRSAAGPPRGDQLDDPDRAALTRSLTRFGVPWRALRCFEALRRALAGIGRVRAIELSHGSRCTRSDRPYGSSRLLS